MVLQMRCLFLAALLCRTATALTEGMPEPCCNCEQDRHLNVMCLHPGQIRAQVDHLEPLLPSGLDRSLNISGIVIADVKFGTDGKVECVRARQGNPIAIAAAMVALPKWTFKPLIYGGARKQGCGTLTIKYRLSNGRSSTRLH